MSILLSTWPRTRRELGCSDQHLALLAARHAAAEDSTPLDCATTGLEPSAADAATSDGTGEVRGEEQPEAFSTAPPDEEDCMRTTGALHEDSTEDDDDGGYGPGWDEELQGAFLTGPLSSTVSPTLSPVFGMCGYMRPETRPSVWCLGVRLHMALLPM